MNFKLFFQTNLLMVGLLALISSCSADSDTAQWRGPNRTGIYPDTGLLSEWPEEGLDQLFNFSSGGNGHSSLVVYMDKIYVSGRIDSLEYISCYDLEANMIWQEAFGNAWYKSFPNTRSTPTIEKNKIYLISEIGRAHV